MLKKAFGLAKIECINGPIPARGGEGFGAISGNCIELYPLEDDPGNGSAFR